ncbi:MULTISPECIES: zinc ribbon domain-containing protein [unclassified Psychrobacter]|uniref:zinc ribbon domain-containing protein n=1 Tax=unclassified Psychrobacter TaxID=196806 RepID=UPI0025B2C371|nr:MULTISPECIES: zinc ribbon domain-containing protein [unclassified Psychrobacter]MDN3454505.1 zinc ribbon domain-containing protein [Psychrobacter sp. APC 3350]MDN3502574.1 zinc ribbon domain-containing protein [Psychrobacter sp. 5A.1]
MLCNNCDQENSSDAGFCSKCGQQLSNNQAQTPPPLTAVNISKDAQSSQNTVSSDSETADTLLAAFVGEKYDSFYRDKWFKDSEPRLDVNNDGSSIHSFNVAGLLLGASWLCYRKMYLVALCIVIGINAVDLILMYMLGMETYSSIGQTSFFIAWAVLTGMLGNYFYFSHSVKNIKKIMDNNVDPAMAEQELVEKGGTTWVGAIVGSILTVLLSMGMSYLFAPDWFWLV